MYTEKHLGWKLLDEIFDQTRLPPYGPKSKHKRNIF